MIPVYVPAEIYRIIRENARYDGNNYQGFQMISNDGMLFIKPMNRTFFEELAKSQPVLEALEKISKEKEKRELQEEIERAYNKHKSLLEKLKDFE